MTLATAAERSLALAGPDHPVWACIVCFRVQAASLQPLVDALRGQVGKILLLDNAPEWEGGIAQLADAQVMYLPMSGNRGTAGAMNQAWQLALAQGAGAMISFDQDSLPPAGMVAQLMASLRALQQAGCRPAAIGPGKIDPRSGKPFRLLLPVQWRRRRGPAAPAPTVEVDHLISSGCLIPADMFRAVGPFREALFLDYVDIEWCLRARALGFALYTDLRTTMVHTIGDQVLQLAGRSLVMHQPLRDYLLVRNHLLLWHLPSVGLYWLLRDLRQVLLKTVLFLLLQPQRRERLRCILKGIRHGLRQQGGPP